MKVEVKKIDPLKRRLFIEVEKERVDRTVDAMLAEIQKHAKIKGFRPGKAPKHLVAMHHGERAREEALRRLIPEVYVEAIKGEKIEPLDYPDIEDVSLRNGVLKITAVVDIKPDITIKNYKRIPIKRPPTEVTEEDVNKTLEYFRTARGEETMDDAFARSMGYPSLDEFKESLKRQIASEKDRQSRLKVEEQIIEHLLKNTKMAVPQSLVQRQWQRRLQALHQQWDKEGLPEEERRKKEDEARKPLMDAAEKEVKLMLIFDKIAENENITAKEGEAVAPQVMEFLLKHAQWE